MNFDQKLARAFRLCDSDKSGFLDLPKVLKAVRFAGAIPTRNSFANLTSKKRLNLTEIRDIAKTSPEKLGFVSSSVELNLAKLLDVTQTGLLNRDHLIEVLTNGDEALSVYEATSLLQDPGSIFTNQRTGEIQIQRFLGFLAY